MGSLFVDPMPPVPFSLVLAKLQRGEGKGLSRTCGPTAALLLLIGLSLSSPRQLHIILIFA